MVSRASRDEGFTTIELLVVMGIAALALAFTVPMMRGSYEHASLRATATSLAAALRSARSEAIRSNRPQTLMLDPARGIYSTSLDARPHRLPAGIAVRVLGPVGAAPGSGVIRFDADGSATAAIIDVSDGGRAARIEVQWQTGSARLSWRS